MQETNRTEIATLGEFGLIKRLTENIQIQNPESKYGIGDDAAVFVQHAVRISVVCSEEQTTAVSLQSFHDLTDAGVHRFHRRCRRCRRRRGEGKTGSPGQPHHRGSAQGDP